MLLLFLWVECSLCKRPYDDTDIHARFIEKITFNLHYEWLRVKGPCSDVMTARLAAAHQPLTVSRCPLAAAC